MKDVFYRKIGEKVKKIRESNGYSQEYTAQLLGINRVSLSQVENGERKITADEVSKLSEVFNISADVLLDLKSEIKVLLSKEKHPPKKEEIRISVPQKRIDKFKEVLLYILNKVGSMPNIGETVIYKLLYFIDFDFYEKFEEQLIGATYIKNYYGPTPLEFKEIVKDMKRNKELEKVESRYFQHPQTKYLPLREPDLSMLNANEVKHIDEVLDRLSRFNASEISEYSHQDVPWLTTENGGIIDYEKVFYRMPPYLARSYIEKDIQ